MSGKSASLPATQGGRIMERKLIDMALETYPYVVIAFFGAVARSCRFGWPGFGQFCAASVVAAFSGAICSLALHDLGAGDGIAAAVAGIAGYSGGAVLDALLGGLVRKIHHHGDRRDAAPATPEAETETDNEGGES